MTKKTKQQIRDKIAGIFLKFPQDQSVERLNQICNEIYEEKQNSYWNGLIISSIVFIAIGIYLGVNVVSKIIGDILV